MRNPHHDHEARAEKLAELTEKHVAEIGACLRAGMPQTVTLIDEALGDFMQDDQARAELLTKTARGENALADVLSGLLRAEAEQRAEAELVRMERRREEEARQARIEQRVFDRIFPAFA